MGPPRKKVKKEEINDVDQGEYEVDGALRRVVPYDYTFSTWAKERWLGRELLEVLSTEFRDQRRSYYKFAIRAGRIQVNGNTVACDYIMRNGDLLTHRVHRHEAVVSSEEIAIIEEKTDVLVISKPGGIPVHPSGRYHHNSVLHILAMEKGFKELFPVNRLDRLTSGVMMLARTKEASIRLAKQLHERTIHKTYLARVRGDFPHNEITCEEPIKVISNKLGLNHVSADGKDCVTTFKKLHFNGRTSLVECKPITGRTHQIRVHLRHLGHPIANDPLYCCDRVWKKYYGENKDLLEEAEKVLFPHDKASLDDEKWDEDLVDAELKCEDCQVVRKDPIPEQLYIYLHAWKYESDDWMYQSDLPIWASEDYEGDKVVEEIFWKNDGIWDDSQ